MAEARVVKAITDMRSQGMSLRQIAAVLSQIGVPTKCRGRGWHPQMVARILKPTPNSPKEAVTNCSNKTFDQPLNNMSKSR